MRQFAKLIGRSSVAGVLLLGLFACSKPPESGYIPTQSWDSYRCTVKGSDYTGTGWSTDEETARAAALQKCQDTVSAPASCAVVSCVADKPTKVR